MKRTNPAERFSTTRFPAPSERINPSDPPLHEIPDYTVYQCPTCTKGIEFGIHNFETAALNPISHLSQDDASRATVIHGRAPKKGESFLDWYCPSCNMAVRAYYSWGVADRGCFTVSIGEVIEGA